MKEDCIFCKIVSGDIPSTKLHESDSVVAFLDAFPLAEGHSLVIPKQHYEKIQDMPSEISIDLFKTVHSLISRVDSLTGSTLVAAHNGKESGQEIPHVHIHLIPRTSDDGAGAVHSMFKNTIQLDDEKINQLQKRLSF